MSILAQTKEKQIPIQKESFEQYVCLDVSEISYLPNTKLFDILPFEIRKIESIEDYTYSTDLQFIFPIFIEEKGIIKNVTLKIGENKFKASHCCRVALLSDIQKKYDIFDLIKSNKLSTIELNNFPIYSVFITLGYFDYRGGFYLSYTYNIDGNPNPVSAFYGKVSVE